MNASRNRQVQEMLFGSPATPAAAAAPADAPAASHEAVVMVVNSSDPDQTRKQLAAYFTTNNIAWESASAGREAEGVRRVDELVDGGVGVRFDPRRDGRVMKEWLVVEVAAARQWSSLAREAFAFAAPAR